MNRSSLTCRLALLSLALLTAPAPRVGAAGTVEPKAKEVMRRMSDFLAGLKQFRVHTDTITEEVYPKDLTLLDDRASDVYVQRPNHMRVNLYSASANPQFFMNGQTVTLYTPKLKYYANWQTPGTIDTMLDRAQQRYGLSFPATDLMRRNPYQVFMKNVKSGAYLGHSLIRNAYCYHLSFRQQDMDWQIWIEDSKTPYPRRLVIYDRAVKGKPCVVVSLSQWNSTEGMPDGVFTFTPPEGTTKIAVSQLRR